MDLAFGNLATPLKQFGAAMHNGNLACQEQLSSAAARHGNPTTPVQQISPAINQGNLGGHVQLSGTAAHQGNLGGHVQLSGTAAHQGNLGGHVQLSGTAAHQGNLGRHVQLSGAAAHQGNLGRHVQLSGAAAHQGNLGDREQRPSAATTYANLGHYKQLPSTFIDASDVNHAGNLDAQPGIGGALSTNHSNISSVNFMLFSCSDYLPIFSSSTTLRSDNTASVGIPPGQNAFANVSTPSLGPDELSGNRFDPRMAKILVNKSLQNLQANLCFDPNDISVPVDANCSLESQCAVVRSNIRRIDEHLRLIEPDHRKISEISDDWLRYVMDLPTQMHGTLMADYDTILRNPATQQVVAQALESARILKDHFLKEKRLLGYLESELREAHRSTVPPPPGFASSLLQTRVPVDHTLGQAVNATQVVVATVTTAATYSPPTVTISRSWSNPPSAPFLIPTVTAPYVAPPPHISVHRLRQPKPSTPRRPLLLVEPLKLDKFSGDIAEWPGFWKQFYVAVDSQEYSDIEKINLLYQCLVGEAKSRVVGIPRSEENYALVKHLLRDAYDRPDRLLRNLMERLEEMRIPQNTPCDLKTFHMELEAICRQLEAMGHDVNNLSTRLIIQKRLPRNLIQKWMETSGVDERMWTSSFLRDKLRYQVEVYESLGDYRLASEYSTQVYDDAPQRFTTSDGVTYVVEESSTKVEKNELPSKRPTAVRRKLKCPFCTHDHRAAKCDIYSSLQQRLRRAAAKGLCTRCLRGKHSANKCNTKIGPCRECSGKHHISLCDRLLSKPATSPLGQVSSQPNKVEAPTRGTALSVADKVRDCDSDDFWKDNYLESEVDCPDSSEDEFGSIEQELEDAAVTAHNEPATIAVQKTHKIHSCLLAVASGRVSKPTASGRSERVYVLLDSCSSTTYISKEVATKLKLKQAPSRKYNVSTFGSAKPKAMIASDATFDLHLTDGRRLNISAEVVPHIVGHTAMYDESDTDLGNWRRMKSEHLPTKPVQPDILIGTKHLYQVGFMPTSQRLRSGFTVVSTNLGLVITGRGNMVTNLKPVDSCNLAIQDQSEEKKRRKLRCPFCGRGHRPTQCDIYTSLEQRTQRASANGLCTRCLRGKHSLLNCTVQLGPCRACSRRHHIAFCDLKVQNVESPSAAAARGLSRSESHDDEVRPSTDLSVDVIDLSIHGSFNLSTSAAAARDLSRSEGHVDEHESDAAKEGPDLHDVPVLTELSESVSDLPVDQHPGPPNPHTESPTQAASVPLQHPQTISGTRHVSVCTIQPIRTEQDVSAPAKKATNQQVFNRRPVPGRRPSPAAYASGSVIQSEPMVSHGSGRSSTVKELHKSAPPLSQKHRSSLALNESGFKGQCPSRTTSPSASGFHSTSPTSHGSETSSSEVDAHRSAPPFRNKSVSTCNIDMDLIRQAVRDVMDERSESTTSVVSNRSAPRTSDISVPATSITAMGSNRSASRTSDISVPTANVDMDLIRQAVREVMEEQSGQAAATPPVGGVREHRRDDDGRRDDRGRSRERGQKISSG